MGFKENLLKKIEIEQLGRKVAASVAPQADAAKFDKSAMRRLLEMGEFSHVAFDDRGLDLYILENDGDRKKILVLDNGLAIYRTSVDDVALRKSPTVKEMISIRNAIKILNDSDVRLSKRDESVATVERMLIEKLDLNYQAADIADIARDGVAALEGGYVEGVLESLLLLGELLGFGPAPKQLQAAHREISGAKSKGEAGEAVFGPAVIYDKLHNTLRLVRTPVSSRDRENLDRFNRITNGEQPPSAKGAAVFEYLRDAVLAKP